MEKFSYNEVLKLIAIWDQTETEIRHRVRDPKDFRSDTFRSKELEGINGVQLILGKLKPEKVPDGGNPDSMVLQSYRFSKEHWTLQRAKDWTAKQKSDINKKMAKMHTKIACELKTIGEAKDGAPRTFDYILCHVGMNKNGDFFTQEELQANHQTIVDQKIDLQHSENLSEIVGKTISSDFTGGEVSCSGVLFDFDIANQAYTLLKNKFIKAVSMECDYMRGTCSICGKIVKTKKDYCIHLRNYKGGEYKGSQVYETLDGVKFTGVGLLERNGADPHAVITAVSSCKDCKNNKPDKGSLEMEELATAKAKITKLENALKDVQDQLKANAAKGVDKLKEQLDLLTKGKAESDAKIKDLEQTIADNTKTLASNEKSIKEYQAKEKKAVADARKTEYFALREIKGCAIADEQKEAEGKKIADMDEGTYSMLKDSLDNLPDAKADGDGDDDNGDNKTKASTKPTTKMSVKANIQQDKGKKSTDDELDGAFFGIPDKDSK